MPSHEDTLSDIRRRASKWLTEYLTSEERAKRESEMTFDESVQVAADAIYEQRAALGITAQLEELGGNIAQMSALREISRGVLRSMLELASESA